MHGGVGFARVCACGGLEADGTCLISLSQRNETGTGLANLQARLMVRDMAPTQAGGIAPLFKDNEMTMYSMYH